jgi:hypothetical protein
VDPANRDYHLSPRSPCIEHGDNAILQEIADLLGVPVGELTDIDGESRLFGWLRRPWQEATVDMGADEFHPSPLDARPKTD